MAVTSDTSNTSEHALPPPHLHTRNIVLFSPLTSTKMAALLLQYSAELRTRTRVFPVWTSGGAFSVLSPAAASDVLVSRSRLPGCLAVTFDLRLPGSDNSQEVLNCHFLVFNMIFKNRFVASANRRGHKCQLIGSTWWF